MAASPLVNGSIVWIAPRAPGPSPLQLPPHEPIARSWPIPLPMLARHHLIMKPARADLVAGPLPQAILPFLQTVFAWVAISNSPSAKRVTCKSTVCRRPAALLQTRVITPPLGSRPTVRDSPARPRALELARGLLRRLLSRSWAVRTPPRPSRPSQIRRPRPGQPWDRSPSPWVTPRPWPPAWRSVAARPIRRSCPTRTLSSAAAAPTAPSP